jgi:hypothetical protein
MINPTINQLIDRFRAFADGHFYIRAFEVGALNESDLTKDMTYPFMNVEYANTNPVPRQNSYTFIVSFADLPRRKDEVRQNIQEIHSDLTLIALDLLKEIRNGNVLFGEDIDFADGVVITPFTDENHNFISGVTMELTITAPDNWNACIIPADFAVGGTGYPSESLRVFSLPIYDEGNFVVDAYDINFVGSGVTVTHVGNRAVVTITGGGGGGDQNLQEVTDNGNTTTNDIQLIDAAEVIFGAGGGVLLDNASRLREGTIDANTGGSKGIALICGVGYELKWEAGSQYVMNGNGDNIRVVNHKFNIAPAATDDSASGFYVGSRWILDNGDIYVCTDATIDSAVWEIETYADWNATSGSREIANKPSIPTLTSDLTNDGEDGVNPFITAQDIPSLTGYVPYTGATTDVDLGTHNLTADHIALNVNPSGSGFVVGATQWNNSLGSSQTLLKGGNVILKNGVDLVARIVNKVTPNTTLTKASYQAVRVSGATGGRLSVALARADSDANSADTIGLVCETIAPNQEGFIITVGQLLDVNTTGSLQGETWADGDVLYLSPTTAGRITKVKPTGAGHIVVIGYVEYAHAVNGSIYVKVMNGWELDELHDVDISNPQNNDFLRYNSTFGTWKNHALTKTDVGLGNVDNTSDANKPISTATQTALDTIQVELDKNIEIALTGSNVTTTSATAVDVTGLVTPTLPASSTWYFEVLLTTACTGAGGIKFGFTAPSGAAGTLFIEGTSTAMTGYQQSNTTGALSGTGVNRFNGPAVTKMYGRVIMGVTAGAIQLQFASGTSGQTSTISGTGASMMRLTRVV